MQCWPNRLRGHHSRCDRLILLSMLLSDSLSLTRCFISPPPGVSDSPVQLLDWCRPSRPYSRPCSRPALRSTCRPTPAGGAPAGSSGPEGGGRSLRGSPSRTPNGRGKTTSRRTSGLRSAPSRAVGAERVGSGQIRTGRAVAAAGTGGERELALPVGSCDRDHQSRLSRLSSLGRTHAGAPARGARPRWPGPLEPASIAAAPPRPPGRERAVPPDGGPRRQFPIAGPTESGSACSFVPAPIRVDLRRLARPAPAGRCPRHGPRAPFSYLFRMKIDPLNTAPAPFFCRPRRSYVGPVNTLLSIPAPK